MPLDHATLLPGSPASPIDEVGSAPARSILAFVGDAESELVLSQAAPSLRPAQVEVRRGGAPAAARHVERQGSPDILVVDISGNALPVTALQSLAEVCEPRVKVIAIGERNDVGLYRQLKAIGVADYLYKPLTPTLTVEALGSVLGTQRVAATEARLGRVIAVTGARGGAGATTLAVNLADHLAALGRRVALVDADTVTGTAALLLNATPGPGLAEALAKPDRVDDVFLEGALAAIGERLHLLASEAPIRAGDAPRTEAILPLIEALRSRHHYVVVDLPGPGSTARLAVLGQAWLRLVAFGPTLASARDAGRLADALDDGPGQRLLTVLVGAGAPGALKDPDIAKALGAAPDHRMRYRPGPLASAANLGVPAIRGDRAFRAEIARIARDVCGVAEPRLGLLQRILGR
jgi:pilus assembly protein CpaE